MQELYTKINEFQKLIYLDFFDNFKLFLNSAINFTNKHDKLINLKCINLLNEINKNYSKYEMLFNVTKTINYFQSVSQSIEIRKLYIEKLQKDKNINSDIISEIILTQKDYQKYEFTNQDLEILFDKTKCNQIEEIYILNETLRLQYTIINEIFNIINDIFKLIENNKIKNNFYQLTFKIINLINLSLIKPYTESINLINSYYESNKNLFIETFILNLPIMEIKI
jgi:hypothetical protein